MTRVMTKGSNLKEEITREWSGWISAQHLGEKTWTRVGGGGVRGGHVAMLSRLRAKKEELRVNQQGVLTRISVSGRKLIVRTAFYQSFYHDIIFESNVKKVVDSSLKGTKA